MQSKRTIGDLLAHNARFERICRLVLQKMHLTSQKFAHRAVHADLVGQKIEQRGAAGLDTALDAVVLLCKLVRLGQRIRKALGISLLAALFRDPDVVHPILALIYHVLTKHSFGNDAVRLQGFGCIVLRQMCTQRAHIPTYLLLLVAAFFLTDQHRRSVPRIFERLDQLFRLFHLSASTVCAHEHGGIDLVLGILIVQLFKMRYRTAKIINGVGAFLEIALSKEQLVAGAAVEEGFVIGILLQCLQCHKQGQLLAKRQACLKLFLQLLPTVTAQQLVDADAQRLGQRQQ